MWVGENEEWRGREGGREGGRERERQGIKHRRVKGGLTAL